MCMSAHEMSDARLNKVIESAQEWIDTYERQGESRMANFWRGRKERYQDVLDERAGVR